MSQQKCFNKNVMFSYSKFNLTHALRCTHMHAQLICAYCAFSGLVLTYLHVDYLCTALNKYHI